MEFFKHSTQSVPAPVSTNGAGTNDGHGMSTPKKAKDQMNASYMITDSFVKQVPAAGTPAPKVGKNNMGKQSLPMGEVNPHGNDAGK